MNAKQICGSVSEIHKWTQTIVILRHRLCPQAETYAFIVFCVRAFFMNIQITVIKTRKKNKKNNKGLCEFRNHPLN